MVRHWTPKPAIISCTRSSPTGGNYFFAVVKSFEYKIAISANFVQTVKNSIKCMFFKISICNILFVIYFTLNHSSMKRYKKKQEKKYWMLSDI